MGEEGRGRSPLAWAPCGGWTSSGCSLCPSPSPSPSPSPRRFPGLCEIGGIFIGGTCGRFLPELLGLWAFDLPCNISGKNRPWLADFVTLCVPIKVKFAVRSSGNWVLFRAENGDVIDAQLNSSWWTDQLKIILPVRFCKKADKVGKNEVKENFFKSHLGWWAKELNVRSKWVSVAEVTHLKKSLVDLWKLNCTVY